MSKGGTQTFRIDAGTGHSGKTYLLVGTATGTTPGIPLAPRLTLPLNYDPYFQLTFDLRNVLIANSLGSLDAGGQGTASLTLPPLQIPSLVGVRLHHAYVVATPTPLTFHLASNPVPLTLVK